MTTAPTHQPEALRLAAWLKEGAWHQIRLGDVEAAGSELKRLHAENECLHAENECLRAELEARKPLPPTDMTPVQHVNALVGDGLTAQKVEAICEREPYDVTGVVLSLPDGCACIVNQAAVRWFHGPRDFWELMHGRPS